MITKRQFQTAENTLRRLGVLDVNNYIAFCRESVRVVTVGEERRIEEWDDLVSELELMYEIRLCRNAIEMSALRNVP